MKQEYKTWGDSQDSGETNQGAIEYKPWGSLTPEEKGALHVAFYQGKTIQYFHKYYKSWYKFHGRFSPNSENYYRVKPEPVVEVVAYKFQVDKDDTGRSHAFSYPESGQTHKITFNVVDGEPDCSSVNMEKL